MRINHPDIIYPGIFGPHSAGLNAFFTGKSTGIAIGEITSMPLYMPVQEHTGTVQILRGDMAPQVADAVVTRDENILIGVKVADCVPILLYDPVNRIAGAVHAGWRGTAAGILKKTVATMVESFETDPTRVLMAIGPAIRGCCYTVGADVIEAVVRATGEGGYHRQDNGRRCLDLQDANKHQAVSVNIPEANIQVIEQCTFCYPERYYSYRRTQAHSGRQGAFIGMTGAKE